MGGGQPHPVSIPARMSVLAVIFVINSVVFSYYDRASFTINTVLLGENGELLLR